MLADGEIIAFLETSDPERARRFYSDVLGLTFVADTPFALIFDLNGTMLRISTIERFTPAPYTVLGWKVADLRRDVEALRSRGISFERYETLAQDDLDIWTSPDGTQVAWFKDPDGNLLSLSEFPEPEAA